MFSNSADQNNGQWIKSGSLILDLSSLEKGFQQEERSRKEIWDYIQYRESLLKWPSTNNPPSPSFSKPR